MKLKVIIFTLFLCCLISSCKKEYTVEIERIEVWKGDIKRVSKDIKSETFEAKTDEEAAIEAYEKYAVNIITCAESDKRNSAYLWIPVSYKIKDKDGNHVSNNIDGLPKDLTVDYMITSELDSIYYGLLGYFKYVGTPYGRRHPKPSPF